jgi:succinyl-CoA synthetase beta subunit
VCGWDGYIAAEFAQRSTLLQRRRRRLEDELQLIRERISQRFEFTIKRLQSISLPLMLQARALTDGANATIGRAQTFKRFNQSVTKLEPLLQSEEAKRLRALAAEAMFDRNSEKRLLEITWEQPVHE